MKAYGLCAKLPLGLGRDIEGSSPGRRAGPSEEDPGRRGGVPPVAAGDILAGLRSVRDSGLGRRSSAPSRQARRSEGPHSGTFAKGSPIVHLFLGIAGLRFAVLLQLRFGIIV